MKTEPLAAPAKMPFSPKATASTSTGPGSDVKTISEPWAASFGEPAQRAPASRIARAPGPSRSMSWAAISCPARARHNDMGPPIAPSPMNAIFMCLLLVVGV